MACACNSSLARQRRVGRPKRKTTVKRTRTVRRRGRQYATPAYGYTDAGGGTDVLIPQGRIGRMSATTMAGSGLPNNYLGGGKLSFAPYAASVLPIASVKAAAASAAVAAAQRRYRKRRKVVRRR